MPKIAVIGVGLIGRSWSIVFARAGWDVALYDAAAILTVAAIIVGWTAFHQDPKP
jgi:L-gulonate 3-dehydrogenase